LHPSGILEHTNDSWGAYCPELPGVGVVGGSRAEVGELIREAIELHLESTPTPEHLVRGRSTPTDAPGIPGLDTRQRRPSWVSPAPTFCPPNLSRPMVSLGSAVCATPTYPNQSRRVSHSFSAGSRWTTATAQLRGCSTTARSSPAPRRMRPTRRSRSVTRLSLTRTIVFSPCGVCRERLAVYGPDVLAAVADLDDPTVVIWTSLKEVLPDYSRTALGEGVAPGWRA
jgi:predicted RNase H-like HicB family nuclease